MGGCQDWRKHGVHERLCLTPLGKSVGRKAAGLAATHGTLDLSLGLVTGDATKARLLKGPRRLPLTSATW